MSGQYIEQFVDLLISHIRSRLKSSDHSAWLESAKDQILADLTLPIRKGAESDPEAYRAAIISVVNHRWYQANFRRKAMEAIGIQRTRSAQGERRVFISYRRSETANLTRHIARLLEGSPGFAVFFDKDSLPAGNFQHNLQAAVQNCDVFLLMTCMGTFERIFDPTDCVKSEILTALSSRCLVVPVLIDGAQFPSPSSLPSQLAQLCVCNAFKFDTDYFDESFHKLLAFIGK